ncbi:MAG: glycosyltransferase family 4 protein [Anaerolineales bacterium]
MKILLLYKHPPQPEGLSTQGQLLCRGLEELQVEVRAAHFESAMEKEWYYHWFQPDVVLGVGYWGHTPHLVLHPQRFGRLAVPWLVADGFVANYRDTLNALPLVLVTSNWVRQMYIRDGVREDALEVLPVGCDTEAFIPRPVDDAHVQAMRKVLGISPDQLLILTMGGDGASKGAREVMRALARIRAQAPDWRYVCKVWPQPRTAQQNVHDLQLADELGLADRVVYPTDIVSRELMSYLMAACDIYAAPSRLEGFGMGQVEANACGKPVVGLKAMGMLDTLVHGQTALLARVARENYISETVLGPECGFAEGQRITLNPPRIADYRADVSDLAEYLLQLMQSPELRARLGAAGRQRVVEHFDYRVVAQRLLQILSDRFGLR